MEALAVIGTLVGIILGGIAIREKVERVRPTLGEKIAYGNGYAGWLRTFGRFKLKGPAGK